MLKRKKELNEFKNNLNSYMNATITRQLIKNPQCSYKDMYIKTYSLTAIRIKEDYFNDNIFSILLKEVQYQQFKYLGKVFKSISDSIRNDRSVIFLDCVSLKAEEG
jgi:protein-arginine kinase activator protein McsA